MLNLLVALLLLLLPACSPDYGVHVTYDKDVPGDIVFDEGVAADQALDIMVIQDESGSMSNERAELAKMLPIVLEELDGADYANLTLRVGLRSADPGNQLAYGWVDWTNAAYPELEFAALLASSGSGYYEQGLDSALVSMAFDAHRPEADLLFWILSDEPDQSSVTPEAYLNYAANYKTAPFAVFTGVSVYSKGDPCAKTEQIGTGYLDVADVVTSLCEPDTWPDILSTAAAHVPALNKYWQLSRVPVDQFNELYVEWDDVLVPDDIWMYNGLTNQIVFDSDSLPPAGTTVTITYLAEEF